MAEKKQTNEQQTNSTRQDAAANAYSAFAGFDDFDLTEPIGKFIATCTSVRPISSERFKAVSLTYQLQNGMEVEQVEGISQDRARFVKQLFKAAKVKLVAENGERLTIAEALQSLSDTLLNAKVKIKCKYSGEYYNVNLIGLASDSDTDEDDLDV